MAPYLPHPLLLEGVAGQPFPLLSRALLPAGNQPTCNTTKIKEERLPWLSG